MMQLCIKYFFFTIVSGWGGRFWVLTHIIINHSVFIYCCKFISNLLFSMYVLDLSIYLSQFPKRATTLSPATLHNFKFYVICRLISSSSYVTRFCIFSISVSLFSLLFVFFPNDETPSRQFWRDYPWTIHIIVCTVIVGDRWGVRQSHWVALIYHHCFCDLNTI